MRASDRDEYENWDEYEDDDEELQEGEASEEEYEEAEEIHQPTQEELDYLGLRQRLKEAIRKKMKKESGLVNSSSISKRNFPAKDNFGSFFGPSQPVIAQRVILESKSLLENPDLAARVFKSNNAKNLQKNSTSGSTVGSKPQSSSTAPKVTNGGKTKVQLLKNTRDYSFLLSDDAELPAPAKDRIPQKVSLPHSDARSAKMQPRTREPPSNSGRKVQNGREERNVKPSGQQAQGKTGTQKFATLSKPKQTLVDSKKQVPSSKAIGPGRPSVGRAVPSNVPAGMLQKNVSAPGARNGMPCLQKPISTKSQPSASKQPMVQKRDVQASYQTKVLQKHPVSSSKSQIKQPQPRKSHLDDERASRKPIRRDEPRGRDKPRRRYADDDDEMDAIAQIRKMFNYKPVRQVDDGDDSDMEANFDEILQEEKRSSKIAKKEDEEALREILEEERREQLRKEAKKRKLSQR